MYLSKQLTDSSLPEIGKKFGGKHHTTVIHSVKKIEKLRETDSGFDKKINRMIRSIR
jgi:chromosomal replication initiator protein